MKYKYSREGSPALELLGAVHYTLDTVCHKIIESRKTEVADMVCRYFFAACVRRFGATIIFKRVIVGHVLVIFFRENKVFNLFIIILLSCLNNNTIV